MLAVLLDQRSVHRLGHDETAVCAGTGDERGALLFGRRRVAHLAGRHEVPQVAHDRLLGRLAAGDLRRAAGDRCPHGLQLGVTQTARHLLEDTHATDVAHDLVAVLRGHLGALGEQRLVAGPDLAGLALQLTVVSHSGQLPSQS